MRNLSRFWSLVLATLVLASAAIAHADPPAAIPADGPLDPAQDHFSRDSDVARAEVARASGLEATATANRVTHAVAQHVAPRWITIMGNVKNAGSYELDAETISLADLLARAGGPAKIENQTIQIVRDGRPWGRVESPETPLKAGDLLIVQNPNAPPAGDRVTLGLIGLTDTPIAVSVGAGDATINGILKLAHQTHLNAEMITVLIDGARKTPLQGADRLPSGAVLVFDPATVHHDKLPPLPTNRVASASRNHILLANQAIGDPSGARSPDPRDNSTSGGHVTITSAVPAPQDLSPLPSVQQLGPPPADAPLPRTADASGAVPIGPPEVDSHIVRFPRDEFLAPIENERLAAAPDPPPRNTEPIGLPAEEPRANESSSKNTNDSNIWPILLISLLLGGGTFYLIRRFRGHDARTRTLETLRELKSSLVSRSAPDEADTLHQPPATIKIPPQSPLIPARGRSKTAELAPADLLSALVANRLPLREETVELPRALFVQGRSTAPARRRVDSGNRPATAPQIFDQLQTPSIQTAEDESTAETIFDPAEPLSGLALAERTGTPFEQALAKLRGSH